MAERTIHHGRNIKRIREIQGIKQEALALELGEDWNQKKVSLLENKEVVDDELLGEVAKALKVTPEAIRNFDEEAAFNIIATTFNSHDYSFGHQCTFNINPIDKWMEALEENKKLYERLLQAEKEKVAMLEQRLEQKN